MTVSDRPRRAWTSRLDPINWPSGIGIVLFAAWVAYAVASTVWLHLLLWTVLPAGLALYLFAERYPWPVIVIFVVPLTLLTAFAQVVATWADTPLWISFAIYLIACGYFSVVVSDPNRDRWTARLPRTAPRRAILGAPGLDSLRGVARRGQRAGPSNQRRQMTMPAGTQRLTGSRSGLAGNPMAAGPGGRRGQRTQAWLEGLDTLAGIEPSADQFRHVNDLLTKGTERTCWPSSKRLCWTLPQIEASRSIPDASTEELDQTEHCFRGGGTATLCAWGNNTDCRR